MYIPERSVLHLNVADFSVAVERVIDLTLREKPLIVAPLGASRAVVYDMSEEAFADGVRKGMKLQQAMRMCRRATLLAPRFSLYQKAMGAFVKQAYNFTPLIEHGAGDGHLFLDITGTHRLLGPAPDVGLRLQKEVRKVLRFNPIWALATNKLVAKVASRLVKPVGEYIVGPGEERAFLAPLSISLLPGIQRRELEILNEFNLKSIGQLAGLSHNQLRVPFGKRSEVIHDLSQGVDRSQVVAGDPLKTKIVAEHTFATDTNNQREIEGLVAFLAGSLGQQLRREKRTARRIGVWLTYSDGSPCVRQATNKQGVSSDFVLVDLALLALRRAWLRRTRIRHCQLSCDLFQKESPQLSLFALDTKVEQKQKVLLTALDAIKKKYGARSILTGQQNRCAIESVAQA